jgi:hypothetical protein
MCLITISGSLYYRDAQLRFYGSQNVIEILVMFAPILIVFRAKKNKPFRHYFGLCGPHSVRGPYVVHAYSIISVIQVSNSHGSLKLKSPLNIITIACTVELGYNHYSGTIKKCLL